MPLSLATTVLTIDVLRAAQGVGAAGALAGGSAALAQEVEGTSRTRAFSLLGTTFGVGLAFGPILAGAMIERFGWRTAFLVTTVVGLAALVECYAKAFRDLSYLLAAITAFCAIAVFASIRCLPREAAANDTSSSEAMCGHSSTEGN